MRTIMMLMLIVRYDDHGMIMRMITMLSIIFKNFQAAVPRCYLLLIFTSGRPFEVQLLFCSSSRFPLIWLSDFLFWSDLQEYLICSSCCHFLVWSYCNVGCGLIQTWFVKSQRGGDDRLEGVHDLSGGGQRCGAKDWDAPTGDSQVNGENCEMSEIAPTDSGEDGK